MKLLLEKYEIEFRKFCKANRIRYRRDEEAIPTARNRQKSHPARAQCTGQDKVYIVAEGYSAQNALLLGRELQALGCKVLSYTPNEEGHGILATCKPADFLPVAKRLGMVKSDKKGRFTSVLNRPGGPNEAGAEKTTDS